MNTVAQQSAHHFQQTVAKTVACQYLLFLPQGYEQEDKRWPTILFLHGAGERGDDINLIKKHGLPKILEQRKDFPFIVISPQCPANQWWDNDVLIALLEDIASKYRVDRDRIYLTGLSMGGFGTWSLAIRYPDRFAAIAPICGGGSAHQVAALRKVPVWVFHGAKDNIVPIEESQRMVDALKKADGQVEFTIYPQAGHDSWTETYANPELYDWFLRHHRQ